MSSTSRANPTETEGPQRSEDLFHLAFEAAPTGIVVVDRQGRIALVNEQAERLFGYSRGQLVGHSMEMLVPERFRARHPEHSARFFEDLRQRPMGAGRDLFGVRKDGVEIPVEIGLNPMVTSDGTLVLASIIDISERKRAEDEVRRARRAAEEANRELEAFSYSVAHDLRAPLRSIDGFSQALLEDCADRLDNDGKRYLKHVREAAQQMGELIDDLLNLSRVTRAELRRERVDLSDLAHAVLARLREAEPERKVEFVVQDGLVAQVDPRLLDVVLVNLFGNAWKFTGKRASACIEFGAEDGKPLVFFVRDDGAGFNAAYAGKLFGVFQRLHGAHEFEGTGIGLATVERIVRRHGGRVWAEGEVNRGATFYFTLEEDQS